MDIAEQIRNRLSEIAGQHGPLHSILATVVSVDENELTCVLQDDDIEINDVRLSPVINSKQSVTIIPKVGSWVLAVRIENDAEWMIMAADEIDKYRVTVGDLVFEMDGEKFLIKKGNENLKKICFDWIETSKNEKHMTNSGVTISLTTASLTAYNSIKTRLNNFLKDA